MRNRKKTVVNVFVQNLIVASREVRSGDKPAGAGKLKRILVDLVWITGPFLVSEVQKWMSNFNIN